MGNTVKTTNMLWIEPLTPREAEILNLLAINLTNREIATRLSLAPSTVNWYLQQIYAKIGVHQRREAVRRAKELNLLDGSPTTQPARVNRDKPTKHNLPTQFTSFVGRKHEITDVEALLRNDVPPLVTLTGPGGAGKTRLALEIAGRLVEQFMDGVWLVELAALETPEMVFQAVVSVFGLPVIQGQSYMEVLQAYLQKKHMLLVLDNCEHLVQSCVRMARDFMQACPGVRLLVTSREALQIDGEYIFPVRPLSYPEDVKDLHLENYQSFEAVQLFLDRAQTAFPGFQLQDHNAVAIAQICRRLDGIPLALELAAARINMLRADQIASRLENSFQLLTNGGRTAPLRHRTLRASINWSYDLLSENERTLLRRLSIFAGGWTLEAAELVCSDDVSNLPGQPVPSTGIQLLSILDLLSGLVQKSLVIAERRQGAETRYRLLDTVRQYAHEKLESSGELNTLHRQHLEYYMGWAEKANKELQKSGQIEWYRKIDSELENLRLGLTWSIDHDPAIGLRLTTALSRYWNERPMLTEGLSWFMRLINLPENLAPTSYRARALVNMSGTGYYITSATEGWVNESLAISEAIQDEPTRARALNMKGIIYNNKLGKYEEAQQLFNASLEAYRAINEPRGMAAALFNLAKVQTCQGDSLASRQNLDQSLNLYHEVGDLSNVASVLENLGLLVANTEGDLNGALRLVEEAFGIYHQANATELMNVLYNYAYIYAYLMIWKGNYEIARKTLQSFLEAARNSGSLSHQPLAEGCMAYLNRQSGQEQQALIMLEDIARQIKTSEAWIINDWHNFILRELAYLLGRRGEIERARGLLHEILATNNVPERALTLHCRGSLALAEGNRDEAYASFRQCLEICREIHHRLYAILALEGLADAVNLFSMPEPSARIFAATAGFRRRVGAPVSRWDRPGHTRLRADLIRKLGKAAFAKSWREGVGLPFDEAIEFGLAIRILSETYEI